MRKQDKRIIIDEDLSKKRLVDKQQTPTFPDPYSMSKRSRTNNTQLYLIVHDSKVPVSQQVVYK